MKALLVIPVLMLMIIPSLAFATTHQETFPTFYRNMTIFKGDSINVTNNLGTNFQVDGDGFGSGSLSNGTHALFTFNRIGDFAVFDDLNRQYSGFINVIDPTLTPVIFTNETSYKTGDIVDIYGTNLIPVTSQTVTIFDSNGQVDQVLNTPVISDRSLFLPITIPALGVTGEWKIVIIQNGQVITNSFIVTQGLIPAKNNDTTLSSPGITNSTIPKTNSTITNSTITVVSSSTSPSTDFQALSDKIDAQNKKIDDLTNTIKNMKTEQDSIFGFLHQIGHVFGIN